MFYVANLHCQLHQLLLRWFGQRFIWIADSVVVNLIKKRAHFWIYVFKLNDFFRFDFAVGWKVSIWLASPEWIFDCRCSSTRFSHIWICDNCMFFYPSTWNVQNCDFSSQRNKTHSAIHQRCSQNTPKSAKGITHATRRLHWYTYGAKTVEFNLRFFKVTMHFKFRWFFFRSRVQQSFSTIFQPMFMFFFTWSLLAISAALLATQVFDWNWTSE